MARTHLGLEYRRKDTSAPGNKVGLVKQGLAHGQKLHGKSHAQK